MFRAILSIPVLGIVLVHAAVAQDAMPPASLHQPLSIPENYRGAEISLKAWLRMPARSEPAGAVILLHGCNGIDRAGWRHSEDWSHWLNENGYAGLFIDSLTPRGLSNVCKDGEAVPGELRAADLYTAADYVSRLPHLRGKKIGAIGFSHGGWGVLEADAKTAPGIADLRARLEAGGVDVAAFVGMYPGCRRFVAASFYTPLLVLIGDKDDWTSAKNCQRLMAYQRAANEPELRVKVYPDATHSFDVNAPERNYLGHLLRYDPAAATDARAEIRDFLARWLR